MDELLYCQSCGMPLESDEVKGTNADGSKSQEYCAYCYKDGDYCQAMTMQEMIELNLQYLDDWNKMTSEPQTAEQVRAQLEAFLPTLKRWKS